MTHGRNGRFRNRFAIWLGFKAPTHEIWTHHNQVTEAYVTDTLTRVMWGVERQPEELLAMQQDRIHFFRDVARVLKENKTLISHLMCRREELSNTNAMLLLQMT